MAKGEASVGEPVNYHLLLEVPRSLGAGACGLHELHWRAQGGVICCRCQRKGDWRVETIEELGSSPSSSLLCASRQIDAPTNRGESVDFGDRVKTDLLTSRDGRPLDRGLGSGLGRAHLREGRACGVEPERLDSRELVVSPLGEPREVMVPKALIL